MRCYWTFADGARLNHGPPWEIVLAGSRGALRIDAPSDGVVAALARLSNGGGTDEELAALVSESGGFAGVAEWYALLHSLTAASSLVANLAEGDTLIARAVGLSPQHWSDAHAADVGAQLALSPFAFLRAENQALILESASAPCRVTLCDKRAVAITVALHRPRTVASLAVDAGVDPTWADTWVRFLEALGLVSRAESDADPALDDWEFADLLFHSRSRIGRSPDAVGARGPSTLSGPAPPAIKDAMSADVMALDRPSDADRAIGPTLNAVLDARRSVRRHAATPPALADVAEFLFRSARVRESRPADPSLPGFEYTRRPSPSAGACHALEIYLVVQHCQGLADGMYHYDPSRHSLERLPANADARARLLAGVQTGEMAPADAHVLIVIAARFARAFWKYDGLAYANILKDAGALLQTMYLVATSLGLGACAIGTGDVNAFAEATGLSPWEESSVAELVLGVPVS